MPTSTASGGSSSKASHISRRTRSAVASHHRELDDVRRRALDDGVDRQPLPQQPALALLGTELRYRPAATQQRVDEPVALGLGNRLVDERLDGRKALEVALDVKGRLI